MGLVVVSGIGTSTISHTETDSVTFAGAGTLDIVGTAQAPINVTLSQLTTVAAGAVVNITYANVYLNGGLGISALTTFNIGTGGLFAIHNGLSASVSTKTNFTGSTGAIVIDAPLNVPLLNVFSGFGPGKSIDFGGMLLTGLNYVDRPDTNTGGILTVHDAANHTVSITLGDGEFVPANFSLRSDGVGGTWLEYESYVTGLTTSPGTATLGANAQILFTMTTSNPISIVGTPSLLLNDGGVATYVDSLSSPTQSVFRYIVGANQNTADLAVTGISLNNAVLSTIGGGGVTLANAIVNPVGTLVIDTLAPVASSVQTTPGSGIYRAGQVVTFTVSLSEPVLLTGGSPSLLLNDGGVALLDPAHTTATTLSFRHVVQSGNNTPDLAIVGVNLNGATLSDVAGNPFDLTTLVTNPAGILQVDTIAPTVTGVTTNPGSGTLVAGQTVDFVVSLTEAVIFAGSAPVLSLSDGGVATFDAAHSTPTALRFTHTVQAGQQTADLAVTGAAYTGAALLDAAGNQLDLAGAMLNPAGILQVVASNSGTTIPVTPPSVLGVTTSPGSGTVSPGDTVRFSVGVDFPVYIIGGVPTLALSDGGFAVYDPVNSTPTNLVFTTQIQPGQLADDLSVIGYDLHGGTIRDASGSILSMVGALGNPAGVLQVIAAASGALPGSGSGSGSGSNQNPIQLLPTTPATPVTPTTPATPTGPGGSETGAAPQHATLDVYRFFDTNAGTHFYTTSATERDTILSSRPDLRPEGQDGVGLRAVDPSSGDTSAIEVFRFFDTVHGTQFLTASSSERNDLIANRHDLIFQPQGSFFEHAQAQPTDTAVYRFFSSTDGTHFYTDSESERASLATIRPDLIAEGVGFYEPK